MISPLQGLALAGAPDLSDEEVALFNASLMLRPEQRIPRRPFRSYGVIAGRGWGKTLGAAVEINRRVAAGEVPVSRDPTICLVAQNDENAEKILVASLVEWSPPWCRAEPYKGGVLWENGVHAASFTPEAPGRIRGYNYAVAWFIELCDWQESTRAETLHNIKIATRIGPSPAYLWDTTSKGKNEELQSLVQAATADPRQHILRRGTTFENPIFGRAYIEDLARSLVAGSRAWEEEVEGKDFSDAAGALWRQEWLDDHRVHLMPREPELVWLGLDPALSAHATADDVGLVEGARTHDGAIYLTHDWSRKMTPEDYATRVVDRCQAGAAGVTVERNRTGDAPRDLIKAHAEARGLRIEVLPDNDKPLPRRKPGTIWIREVVSTRPKEARASAPAALARQGRVHHVGTHAKLEREQTTWEPGRGRSPNRLDAATFVISDLADLHVPSPLDQQAEISATAKAARGLRSRTRRRRIGI